MHRSVLFRNYSPLNSYPTDRIRAPQPPEDAWIVSLRQKSLSVMVWTDIGKTPLVFVREEANQKIYRSDILDVVQDVSIKIPILIFYNFCNI